MGYLVGSDYMTTVGDCSRRLCLVRTDWQLLGKTRLALAPNIPVYLNCLLFDKTKPVLAPYILAYLYCLLVDKTQEALVLNIHLDVDRFHYSQSYFAISFLISKIDIPNVSRYSHGQNLPRQTCPLSSP